jgi:hypothetical protein
MKSGETAAEDRATDSEVPSVAFAGRAGAADEGHDRLAGTELMAVGAGIWYPRIDLVRGRHGRPIRVPCLR